MLNGDDVKMVSVESIVKETDKMFHELDSDESRTYLMQLVKSYYVHYINNDISAMESCKDKINKALVIYDDDIELKHYLNYCIAKNSNIIIKAILKRNGDLLNPFDYGGESEFRTLHERMQENIEYFKAIESEMMMD